MHLANTFSFFVTETEKLYGPLNTTGVNFVETRRHKLDPKKPITAKPAPTPLKTIPPIQFFDVDCGSNRHIETTRGGPFTGQSWSNKSTGIFVYSDRAFRFLGPRTQRFWETLGTHTDENCQDSVPVPAIVSMRAFPLLPKAAEKLQLRRTVRVKVRVAADGHVIDVEPIDGDPMLIRAALDAARVWRYLIRLCQNAVSRLGRLGMRLSSLSSNNGDTRKSFYRQLVKCDDKTSESS